MKDIVMNTQASKTERQVIAVLCHTDTCCPVIALDPTATADRAVVIQDDFGQAVAMSREQFQVLIDLAQQGKLTV
jgi:hypothetical protein